MTAEPAPGKQYFTAPAAPEPAPVRGAARLLHRGPDRRQQAGARAGYTRASMASLLRDFRAGQLELFAPPGKPGPKTAPAKDRARARVIELRREGLSVYEISARLRAEGTPLNRTGVGADPRRGGLRPAAARRRARGQHQPGHRRAGHPAAPRRGHRLRRLPRPRRDPPGRAAAGLPDLVALDLPALTSAAGYPGTTVIPAASWLLSLLALKLTGTRRVSHVDDLLDRPGQRPVRRAGRPAEEIRAHRLLLPARPTTTSSGSWPPWTRR